jgi:hypothetical protein
VTRKLAPGSILTDEDQKRLYAETMGADALARQATLADGAVGRCTCQPSSVRRRWEGSDKVTSRRVHHPACARWKSWMEEARSSTKWKTS